MDLQGGLDLSRRQLNNFEKPYKWQTSELVAYAQEARNIICREVKCLIDSDTTYTDSPCLIETEVGVLDYVLSPLVIDILADGVILVVSSTDRRILDKTTRAAAFRTYSGWRNVANMKPTKFMTDYQAGYLTFNAPLDGVYNIELSIVRYPLEDLSASDLDAHLEIPVAYHDALFRWGVGYQACLKPGENTYDPEKSQRYEDKFRKEVARFKAAFNRSNAGNEEAGFHEGCM